MLDNVQYLINKSIVIKHRLHLNYKYIYYIYLNKLNSFWWFLELNFALKLTLKCQALSLFKRLNLWSEWMRWKWVFSWILRNEGKNRKKWREKQKKKPFIYFSVSCFILLFSNCWNLLIVNDNKVITSSTTFYDSFSLVNNLQSSWFFYQALISFEL